MLRRILWSGLVLAAVTAAPLAAQRRRVREGPPPPSVGARVGYDFDADHAFVGGQFNFPVARRLWLEPSMEFYPGVTGTPWRLNGDLKYHPPTSFGLFYVGGGIGFLHVPGNTDTGVNVFAGWEAGRYRAVQPFVEAKLFLASSTSFNVLGGLNFPL